MSGSERRPAPWIDAASRVLEGLDALRNAPALGLLLGTFAAAGLLLSVAQSTLAKVAATGAGAGWAAVQAGAAFAIAFYGANAVGLLLMDDARGVAPPRDAADAVHDALRCAHRLLVVLLAVAAGVAALAALVGALMWLSRPALAGPWLGALLFGLVLPAGALAFGLALLAVVAVVVPLAAPAVWSGAGALAVLRQLGRLARRRLAVCALLTGAASLLAAAVAAMCTFAVATGARAAAELAIAVVGLELPVEQLMAGFFGYGLRALGAAHAPAAASGHGAAALVGGGLVFSTALVLPGLVYLRGVCAVYLALHPPAPDAAAALQS